MAKANKGPQRGYVRFLTWLAKKKAKKFSTTIKTKDMVETYYRKRSFCAK